MSLRSASIIPGAKVQGEIAMTNLDRRAALIAAMLAPLAASA
jgi:hypothetical protein